MATTSKHVEAKKRKTKKVGADYVAPAPWTVKHAFQKGDVFTRLSCVIFGLSNLARKQIIKGILFLAIEILYIIYMVNTGALALDKLFTHLQGTKSEQRFSASGIPLAPAPEEYSVTILLYVVAALFITAAFVWFWTVNMRAAYKAQYLKETTGHAPSFLDDIMDLKDGRAYVSMLFLPTLGILIFTILPLLFMISMAFTSYDSAHPSHFDWVGFANFKEVVSNDGGTVNGQLFLSVLLWTLVWAFFATFLNYFLGMFLAMVINRKTTRGKMFWRGVFSMSIAVPQFVSLLVMNTMLQPTGAVNRLLQSWGWISGPLPFFTNATWARVTVIVINLWVGIPFTIMQVTGILQNIPADLYEAAELDGANWWQQFCNITMPYMIFVTTPYLITTFTGNVNNFNVIYLLSGGDPTPVGASAGKTDLLITWLYKLTVDKGDYNSGAVIGIFTFIVLAVVALLTYRSSGSYKNEEGFR